MNKNTIIVLSALLMTVFSCKKDNETEIVEKQLKKVVFTSIYDNITCNFKYENGLIRELLYESDDDSYTNTYTFNDKKQIQTIVYNDGDITRTTSFKYEDNRIIQTSDIPDSDSVLYTLDASGKVIKEEIYMYGQDLFSTTDYKWSDGNVVEINSLAGTPEMYPHDITLTYDDKPNPMCLFPNFISSSDYVAGDLYNLIFSKNNKLTEHIVYDKQTNYNDFSECTYKYKDDYPYMLDMKSVSKNVTNTYTDYSFLTYEYY